MNKIEAQKKYEERRLAGTLLIAIAIVGSIITYFTSSLFFSDISNFFYGELDIYIISTIPGFVWTLYSVLLELYVYRFFYRPQYRKSLTLTYLKIAIGFSIVGIVTSILSGTIVYHDFFAPWIFPAYSFINLVLHSLILIAAIYLIFRFKKTMVQDEKDRPISLQYVGYTTMLSLLIYFAFERFGALLFAPIYIQWSTFYMTFPFYISLLLPMAELAHGVLYLFDSYKNRPKIGFIYSIVMVVLDVTVFGAIFIIGYNNPAFISPISAALALERLASLPLDMILTVAIMIGMTAYEFKYSVFRLNKQKKAEQNQ